MDDGNLIIADLMKHWQKTFFGSNRQDLDAIMSMSPDGAFAQVLNRFERFELDAYERVENKIRSLLVAWRQVTYEKRLNSGRGRIMSPDPRATLAILVFLYDWANLGISADSADLDLLEASIKRQMPKTHELDSMEHLCIDRKRSLQIPDSDVPGPEKRPRTDRPIQKRPLHLSHIEESSSKKRPRTEKPKQKRHLQAFDTDEPNPKKRFRSVKSEGEAL